MEQVVIHSECLVYLKSMPDNCIDSVVTDPPYGISFMGKKWDYKVPSVEIWKEVLRVLKPGGHLLSFGGTRTYHRMVVNIEDAGFEIRDQIMWIYGSGFPKSMNISKAIDKTRGNDRPLTGDRVRGGSRAARGGGEYVGSIVIEELKWKDISLPGSEESQQWDGWGTALKPANEPICLARKPISKKTIVENVLKYGTGGINIDGCRVEGEPWKWGTRADLTGGGYGTKKPSLGNVMDRNVESNPLGRFPANVIHDGSDKVVSMFPVAKSGFMAKGTPRQNSDNPDKHCYGKWNPDTSENDTYGDEGSAARFFYVAKPGKSERNKGVDGVNNHPTLKPVSLMRYLVRLVTPPNGTVLDPFNGSGTTGIACKVENFNYIGIEQELEHVITSKSRISAWEPDPIPDATQTKLF